MFGPNHYVPVLKWKQSEWLALGDISPHAKARMTPLLEVQALPINRETEEPTRSLEDFINAQIMQMTQRWGLEDPFFLDPSALSDITNDKGEDGLAMVYSRAGNANLKFIPVIRLSSPENELLSAMAHSSNGICLRIFEQDFESVDLEHDLEFNYYEDQIKNFLSSRRLKPEEVDLIFDAGDIGELRPRTVQRMFIRFLRETPQIQRWRTITVTSCAFPGSLASIAVNSAGSVQRTDWLIWKSLLRFGDQLPRLPAYGDYGIQNPVIYDDLDWRVIPLYASIRYTRDKDWLIIRGTSSRDVDFRTQFPRLAQQLVNDGAFLGGEHCEGCRVVETCAQLKESAASLGKWRRIGTCHHLTLVTEQLNQTFDSSSKPSQPA